MVLRLESSKFNKINNLYMAGRGSNPLIIKELDVTFLKIPPKIYSRSRSYVSSEITWKKIADFASPTEQEATFEKSARANRFQRPGKRAFLGSGCAQRFVGFERCALKCSIFVAGRENELQVFAF